MVTAPGLVLIALFLGFLTIFVGVSAGKGNGGGGGILDFCILELVYFVSGKRGRVFGVGGFKKCMGFSMEKSDEV